MLITFSRVYVGISFIKRDFFRIFACYKQFKNNYERRT